VPRSLDIDEEIVRVKAAIAKGDGDRRDRQFTVRPDFNTSLKFLQDCKIRGLLPAVRLQEIVEGTYGGGGGDLPLDFFESLDPEVRPLLDILAEHRGETLSETAKFVIGQYTKTAVLSLLSRQQSPRAGLVGLKGAT
jgi:hypothetical protein